MDRTVGVENAARIFEAAKHPKSFVSLDRADHLLSNSADSDYVGCVVAAWARKYVAESEEPAETETAPDNGVTARIGARGYETTIAVRGHELTADEPSDVGGGDRGPTPYDLLLAALNACTAMTLRMYADRKGWPLAAVTVRSRHAKVHGEDCAECETVKGWVDRIQREIELAGELDEQQVRRLLEIADRCPVHRTLHGEVIIETRLAASG